MTNRHDVEALADEIELNLKNGFDHRFNDDEARTILSALRSRTPSAPDVAMREALERIKKIADAAYANDPKLRADGARALKRIAEQADAALSASEAKAGEPVQGPTIYDAMAVAERLRGMGVKRWRDYGELEHKDVLEALRLVWPKSTPAVDREAVAREVAHYRGMTDAAVYSGKHVANIIETVLSLAPAQEGE